MEDRLSTLEGKVEGVTQNAAETRGIVDGLARLKVSGYIQARYEWHDDSLPGTNATGGVTELDRFFVRRARLKTTYSGTNAEYVLQVDAPTSGISLKDAEATFVDTWTPLGLRITLGQFKTPFAYETLQSSQYREMPERALVIRRLLPGERDRGLRVTARYDWLRVALALINGTFDEAAYLNFDHTNYKDFVGRLVGDFGFLSVGVSTHIGRALKTLAAAQPARVVANDANMDKVITPDELSLAAAAPPRIDGYRRLRVGFDAQGYIDVPSVGGLALKGELILGQDKSEGYSGVGGIVANPCNDQNQLGWIVTVVQNVGDYLGAVFRVDSYDPTTSMPSACTTAAAITAAGTDKVITYGGGLLGYPSSNLRATLTYEHVVEQTGKKVDNDIFTAQLQASF